MLAAHNIKPLATNADDIGLLIDDNTSADSIGDLIEEEDLTDETKAKTKSAPSTLEGLLDSIF